jgi:hypothetical protein
MTSTSTAFFRFSIATVLAGASLLWSGQLSLKPTYSLVSCAEARIGRPLTPLSYAGVARRTTRRAVAAGAVVGAAAVAAPVVVAPVVVAPACVQRVDVYGRIVTVCR